MDKLSRELYSAMHDHTRDADGSCRAYFTLPAEFIGFAGHFPGRPILPAVAQLQMGCIVHTHNACTPCTTAAQAARLDNAKFMRPVGPGECILVECIPAKQASVKTTLSVGNTTVASYTVTLAEKSRHEHA